ncbi:MAG: hypothetical protein JWO42_1398, partial [Chloroflexi bacterium]|nr:hypothetical protein [Chloroflexota bacterium]
MVDSSWKVCHASSSLQYALPDEAAREQQAIVVAEEGDCLVIATADPTEPATDQELKASATHASPDESLDQPLEHPPGRARSTIAGERRAELSAITGRPVQLVTASHAEIEIALARSRGGATTQALRWDRFGFLVRDCGLGYLLAEHEQKPQSGPDDQATDRVAAAAAELPDGWGPELLGLLEGMPHMSERDAPFDPALCVLLPPEVRAGWGTFPIVPRGLEDGYLVLGCDRMPDEKILRAVTGWTGFQVRCILCETALLRLVIDTFKSLASGKGRNGKPTGHFEWVRETARTGLKVIPFRFAQLSAAENRQTHAVSYQAGLRRDLAAMPLPSVIQVNNSRTPSLNPDPAALAAIPSQLARSLEILPLKMDQHGVVFGIAEDRPEAQQIRRAVGSLIGKNIRFRVSNGHYLREALSKHCRQTHALQPVQASWRGHRQKRSAPAHVHVPGQRREMGNLAAERRGFVPTQYLPSIRLEHYAIQPEVIKLIPLETLESHCAVPLRREGHVLWVALGEPSEKAVHELAQGAGLTIRPLAASPEAVRARLRLCRVSAHALTTYQSHPVIAYLQQQGRLHETNLLQILDTPGTAVDQALDAAGILDYDEFAVLAAQLCALPQINLRVSYTPESRSMLSGSRALSAVLQDLVDPLVASNMAPNEARALGIVPLRRELMGRAGNPIDAPELPEDASDSCLVVAVADPWSPLIAATLSEPAYGAHRLVVAPRPDIIATIARAHGRAQLGERLLLSGVVSQQDLDRAVQLHQYTGVRIGQALIHLNLISEDQLAYFLSEQLDLPFVGLQAMKPDIELARCLPEHVERRLGILPLYEKGNVIIAVSPDPLNAAALAEAEKRTGRPIQLMICTEGEFEAALEVLYRDLYLATSSSDLATRSPEESAERVITRSQVLTISIIALVALV